MPFIPFAEWRPDAAPLNSAFIGDIQNVLCADGFYIPFPELSALSEPLPGQPFGAFTARDSDGAVTIFAGTSNRLWRLNNTTFGWDLITQLGPDQAVNGDFAADTDWTKDTGVTIAGGAAVFTAVSDGDGLSQSQTLTAGETYKVTFTVSGHSAGGVRARFTGGTAVDGPVIDGDGAYVAHLDAVTGNNTLEIVADDTTTLNIDNVTLEPLADYNSTASERWRFAQFGNYVIAVNANDDPQVFELGVSNEFDDLPGSPPRARFVAVWGEFLALGGLSSQPNRVHWSGLNDIGEWTPGTNFSDYQDFPDGGDVHGMTSATNPIIFQRQAIQFGTFVPGSEWVFTFQKVHDKRGSAAPYAIASRGALTFFADAGGFFQISADGQIAPIGFEKVDRTVFGKIDGAELFGIVGEVDPFYTRVYWAVKYDSTSEAFDRLIIYDWNLQRWTQIAGDIDILFPLSSGTIGYTLEGLDIFGSLDALPYSLDSKVWQGGAPVMAAFDTNNRLGFFSGENAEAILTTQEMGDMAAQLTFVNSLHPVVDTNTIMVARAGRMLRSDPVAWSAEVAPSVTGKVDFRLAARFHRYRVRIPAGTEWSTAQGVDIKAKPSGNR